MHGTSGAFSSRQTVPAIQLSRRTLVLWSALLVFALTLGAGVAPAAAETAPPGDGTTPDDGQSAVQDLPAEALEGIPAGSVFRTAGPHFREWTNADGTVTREMFPGPVFFENAPGVWFPIKLDLVKPSGADSYVPAQAAPGAVRFAPAAIAGQAVVSLSDGVVAEVRYPEAVASSALPVVSGRSITHPRALLGGRDLRLTATTTGFEESVVLHDVAAAATSLTEFRVPVGVTARQEGAGVEFVAADGTVVGAFGGGLAYDSAMPPSEVAVTVTLKSATPTSVVTETSVDRSWLDGGRVFPVTIDPTYTGPKSESCPTSPSTSSGCETYTNSDNLDGASGTGMWQNPELRNGSSGAWQEGSTTLLSDTRIYIKFITDSLGSPGFQYDVSGGTLSMYAYDRRGNTATRYYRAYVATSSPTRNTVWNTNPGFSTSPVSDNPLSGPGDLNYDVTEQTRGWFNGTRTNHGFMTRAVNLRETASFAQFYSWNSGQSTSPRLTVSYYPNPPSAPLNVSATAGNATASVTWSTPSSDGGGTITGYKVETYQNGSYRRTASLSSSARSHTDSSVTNGDNVYFRVYATNSSGNGTAAQSNTVVPVGPPTAPTGVGASAGDRQATVTWSPPTSTGGGSITAYDVSIYYAGSQTPFGSVQLGSLARSYTRSSLANGQPVYFRVWARNASYPGPYAQSPQVTPLGAPSAPQNLQATPGNAAASVTWTPPSDTGGTAVTGYYAEVRRSSDNSFVLGENLGASARSWTASPLVNDVAHYFKVFANNAVGQSAAGISNSVTPVAPPDPRPMVPTLLSPDVAYTFPTEQLPQRFSLVTTDLQNHRYQAYVELVADNGAPVQSTITMPPANSGESTEGQTSVPLLEGRYRWRARACDIPDGHCSDWTNWRGFQVGAPLRASSGSNSVGLEQFFAYERWDTGAGTAFLNTANGNLVLQETDLEVPGPINLRLTRTYNAVRDEADGPLGRGWTLGIAEGEGMADSLLDAVLSLDLERMVRIVGNEDTFEIFDADGTTHHFARGGLAGPGWHSPPGVNLVLTDGQDGAVNRWYHATRPDGVRYEFKVIDGAHRLARIADRKGNMLTLDYSGGKLTRISDGTGRSLDLTWLGDHVNQARYTGAGQTHDVTYTVNDSTLRLDSVTQAAGTSDARTRSFGYNAAGLASVTDARGGVTAFTIGEDDRRLTDITDRAGVIWDIGYDAECDPPSTPGVSSVCVKRPGSPIGAVPAQRTWTVQSTTGNPLSFTDEGDADGPNGSRRNRRSFTWAANRLARTVDEVGNATEFTYNELGQIDTQVFTGAGEQPVVTDMDYVVGAGAGDLTVVREGVGTQAERLQKFGYDHARGLMTSVTDPSGKVSTLTYHANGLLKSVTDPRGNTTSYGDAGAPDSGYHFTGQPLLITDPAGAGMTMSYDFMGRSTLRVDRTGQPWAQTWDARGNLRSLTSPVGDVTTYCYDANNNRVLEIRPKAVSHACGQSGTTAHVTTQAYDARDMPTRSEASSDGQLRATRHSYRADGLRAETILPRSFDPVTGLEFTAPAVVQKLAFDYYANGRLKSVTEPEGGKTDMVYTPNGLLRQITEPPNGTGTTAVRRTTTKTYNGRGQEIQIAVSGEGGSTRHEYDAVGNRTATVNPKGHRTRYAYDPVGRLTTITDPRGKITDRFYDAAGNVTRVRLPSDIADNLEATYTYTARNEIASERDASDPDHSITYTYDSEGRQLLRNDVNGGAVTRTVEQKWRADGLLEERLSSLPTGTTGMHRVVFGYDGNGNPTSVQTYLDGATIPNVSAITVDHTSADEPKTWTETLFPATGPGVTKTSTFAYERDGALTSRAVDGLATSYTHLRNGLESATTPWGGVGTAVSTWNPNSTLAAQSLPNGAVAALSYDPASRISAKVVSRSGVSLSAWQQVVYDANGNRTGEVVSQLQPDGSMKTGNASYSYDVVDRLINAKHPFDTTTRAFALDDGGNILTDGESSYTYGKNRMVKMQPATVPADWPTDVLGPFPAAEFRTEFTYDLHGNMSKAVMPGQGNATTTYTYDAAMHPRRTTEPDGSWVEYAYDGFDRAVRRVESTGDVRLVFHDQGSHQAALETNAAGTAKIRYILDSAGVPLGQEQVGSAGVGWYVTDLRNNLTQLLNASGGVKAVYGYNPFGKSRAEHTASRDGFASRLRYQMAPVDEKTGTYNLGPRLYDPTVNRFLGADHYVSSSANLGLQLDPLTGNRYLYAGANPAGMVDDGHSPGGMNDAEKSFCRVPSRWKLCRQVQQIVERVRADEVRRFPNDQARRNAYRHCCWSAEMTIRLGEKTARGFLDRHEHGADPRDPDHQADLRNNESGIQIAHRTRGTANERVAKAEWECYKQAKNGALVLVG